LSALLPPFFAVGSVLSCHGGHQRASRYPGPCGTGGSYFVDQDKCSGKCNACIELLGCPAITKEDGKTIIDQVLCTGCGICAQVCPYKAIIEVSQ